MRKIGLFGGTFDPPHLGHLKIAKETFRLLQLDEIWFIPTYYPPLKDAAKTDSVHRLNMLQQMIEDEDENFFISKVEIERRGKSYTIDTINHFITTHRQTKFYFIIGGDQVSNLHNWKDIDQLMKKVQFVGIMRPGYDWKDTENVKKIPLHISDISSTDIRKRIKSGKSIKHLVHEKVYTYIKEHELYGYRKSS